MNEATETTDAPRLWRATELLPSFRVRQIVLWFGQLKIKTSGTYIKSGFLFFAATALFIALLMRNSGLYPVVFADEYAYSEFSRLLPLAASPRSGYLYLAIYRLTNVCGNGFLDCCKNTKRRVFCRGHALHLSHRQAHLHNKRRIGRRSPRSPRTDQQLYGVLHAGDALFLSFWLVTWFVLRLDSSSGLGSWCMAGVLSGFSALVKPHALFLLPALVVYCVLGQQKENKMEWVLRAFLNASALVALTFFVKFLISYLLAGEAGLTLLGSDYTSIAGSSIPNIQRFIEVSAESVKGHLLAVCLMFGMPIAFALHSSFSSVVSQSEIKIDQRICCFAIAVLASLILVTGLFTASVMNAGPYETAERLHMRYYDFAFPLFF